jgi:hypothetical protein
MILWKTNSGEKCIKKIPLRTRGVYVLYKKRANKKIAKGEAFDVVYIGMAGGEPRRDNASLSHGASV